MKLGLTVNIPGYIQAHSQILEFDFKHFIGGHLGRSGNRSDVEIQKRYVDDLKGHCQHGIELSSTNDPQLGFANIAAGPLKTDPGNTWALFKAYLDTLARYCADKTNQKWLGKLAGADVFQFDNALSMIESLRIDFGLLGPFGTA